MVIRTREERKRLRRTVLAVAGAVLAAALLLWLCLLLLEGQKTPFEEVSVPTETTASTTVVPTETTVPPTTTTTGTPTASTTATAAPERKLLEYDTTGRYVQPAGAAWNLLLVNDWNAVPASYDEQITLVDTTRNQRVDARMKADLDAMLEAGKAYGIGVQSGYRDYAHQSRVYWRQVDYYLAKGYSDQKAQELAGTGVKRPGYSEHITGLAVDLGGNGNFDLGDDFKDTPAYAWLIENCANYGFILRFPADKVDVTGVMYEPWHYRYVGKEAATAIMSRGLCLEEYLAEIGG